MSISLRKKIIGAGALALAVSAGMLAARVRVVRTPAFSEPIPTGRPQLVSVQPLYGAEGEMCQWAPASAASSLMESLQQEAAQPGAGNGSRRRPLRAIRDPYAAYSAVAVDPVHNEVVMADENNFSIMTYDRLENTPAKSTLSEPKRLIQGMNTDIEFQCGLYVDPANGDIYAVNNDTLEKLVIFSHNARGDVAPDRSLDTPYSTYGIAVNEEHQEMMMTVQDLAAVVTYRKSAKGDEPPTRILQGERTLMADPHGIAMDPADDLLFVANWGTVNERRARKSDKPGTLMGAKDSVPATGKFLPPSITVYARTASGDTAPLRVIQGSKTRLNWPTALAFDPERKELYVANDPTNSVSIFKADASGDVAPIRVIEGPKTLVKNPVGVYVDVKNNEVWVANFGDHAATVFSRDASGDTPPLRVIRSGPLSSPAPMIGNPHTVAYDSKRDQILVAN